MTERENLDQTTESIIGAAIEVHPALGPGLLESAYEACLTFELAQRGLKVELSRFSAFSAGSAVSRYVLFNYNRSKLLCQINAGGGYGTALHQVFVYRRERRGR